MSASMPSAELPKSLQAMIADAQKSIANWEPDEDAVGDPDFQKLLDGTREWLEKLSRGEYEQALYWRCVAEDCEEAGDWNGVIEAHRQILTSPDASAVDHSRAHSQVAAVQYLLGEDEDALESYHLASTFARPLTDVLCRHYTCNEAMHLCRMGRTDEARQLVEEALAIHDADAIVDHLGMGRMLTVLARCDLAKAELQSARESLEVAWQWLESLQKEYEGDESMNGPVGLISACAAWWQVSAKLSELNNNMDESIVALCTARDLATQCAEHSGWSRYDFDFYQMNVLKELAAAYSKEDRFEEASEAMQKANQIQVSRKFPDRNCSAFSNGTAKEAE